MKYTSDRSPQGHGNAVSLQGLELRASKSIFRDERVDRYLASGLSWMVLFAIDKYHYSNQPRPTNIFSKNRLLRSIFLVKTTYQDRYLQLSIFCGSFTLLRLKIRSKASPFRGKSNKMIHCSNPLLSMEEVAVNCQLSTVNWWTVHFQLPIPRHRSGKSS